MADRDQSRIYAELDLSGFRRRLPRAVIAWKVGMLVADDRLRIIVDPTADRSLLLETVRCSGGEVVADTLARDRRPSITVTARDGGSRPVAQELDVRGARCPVPVIEARRRVRKMSRGEQLRLLSDCTGAPAEVGTWAERSADVELLGAWHQADSHVFLLERR